jgi:hypothetical protein
VSLPDAQVPIMHRVFVKNTTAGRHGSAEEGTLSDPVQRFIIQVYPARWQRPTPDPINMEDYTRTITNLVMDVPDPKVYKKHDEVLINGTSFVVQGNPDVDANWADGTQIFPEYDSLFGGQVLIRRVG